MTRKVVRSLVALTAYLEGSAIVGWGGVMSVWRSVLVVLIQGCSAFPPAQDEKDDTGDEEGEEDDATDRAAGDGACVGFGGVVGIGLGVGEGWVVGGGGCISSDGGGGVACGDLVEDGGQGGIVEAVSGLMKGGAAAAVAANDARDGVRDEVGLWTGVPCAGPSEGAEVEGAEGGEIVVTAAEVQLVGSAADDTAEHEHLAVFVGRALMLVSSSESGYAAEIGVRGGGVGDVDPAEGGDGEDVGVGEGAVAEEVPTAVRGDLEATVVWGGGDDGAEGGALGGNVATGGDVEPGGGVDVINIDLVHWSAVERPAHKFGVDVVFIVATEADEGASWA